MPVDGQRCLIEADESNELQMFRRVFGHGADRNSGGFLEGISEHAGADGRKGEAGQTGPLGQLETIPVTAGQNPPFS
jgi:hypothetical protein